MAMGNGTRALGAMVGLLLLGHVSAATALPSGEQTQNATKPAGISKKRHASGGLLARKPNRKEAVIVGRRGETRIVLEDKKDAAPAKK